MKPGSPARTLVLSIAALALFSTVFTLAAFYDWWPRLPPGALHDTDLWAGFAGAAALLLLLLRRKPASGEKVESSKSQVQSPPKVEGPMSQGSDSGLRP